MIPFTQKKTEWDAASGYRVERYNPWKDWMNPRVYRGGCEEMILLQAENDRAEKLEQQILSASISLASSGKRVSTVPRAGKQQRSIDSSEVPEPLLPFWNAIEQSRSILDLKDDWDGEGSPGYAEATWVRARQFLLNGALTLWDRWHTAAPVPEVLEGPYGSIDIYWKLPHVTFLMNIPVESNQKATYYGSRTDGTEIKGSIDTGGSHDWLLMWLAP